MLSLFDVIRTTFHSLKYINQIAKHINQAMKYMNQIMKRKYNAFFCPYLLGLEGLIIVL